jgi:hypothetical protein
MMILATNFLVAAQKVSVSLSWIQHAYFLAA